MIVMGIGQVVQGVGSAYLAADVSALTDRLTIMEGKVSLNAKETKFLMRIISHDVQDNSLFDQVGQIVEMIRLDGREDLRL